MWEEGGLECVRVRNRRASEVRSPEEVGTEDIELEESWDEVIAVEADGEGEQLCGTFSRGLISALIVFL